VAAVFFLGASAFSFVFFFCFGFFFFFFFFFFFYLLFFVFFFFFFFLVGFWFCVRHNNHPGFVVGLGAVRRNVGLHSCGIQRWRGGCNRHCLNPTPSGWPAKWYPHENWVMVVLGTLSRPVRIVRCGEWLLDLCRAYVLILSVIIGIVLWDTRC